MIVGTGVLALLLVEQATGDKMLGGIAFSVGFISPCPQRTLDQGCNGPRVGHR
jgi:hypothetical protein